MTQKTMDRLVAAFFLAGCIAYGLAARNIDLLFGSDLAPFNARTLPTYLAWAGGALSLGIFLFPTEDKKSALKGLAWVPTLALALSVVGYALLIPYIGFFLSSSIFLFATIVVLGERNIRTLLFLPLITSFVLYALLNWLLGVYIADPFLRLLGAE